MSDVSRRKILKSIAAGSGVIVAGKSLPESWVRPVVDAVMMPAHAQLSGPSLPDPSTYTEAARQAYEVVVPVEATQVRIIATGGQGGGGGGAFRNEISATPPSRSGGGGGGGGASAVLRAGVLIAGAAGGRGGDGGDPNATDTSDRDGANGSPGSSTDVVVQVTAGEILELYVAYGGYGGNGATAASQAGQGGAGGFGRGPGDSVAVTPTGGNGGVPSIIGGGNVSDLYGCPPTDHNGSRNDESLGTCRNGAGGTHGVNSSGFGGRGGAPGSITLEWL